ESRFHRSRTRPRMLGAVPTGAAHGMLERRDGRLAAHAAPEEAGLPAGEPRLVDELEVEERADVALAPGEVDRLCEQLRLLGGRHGRHVLEAAVAPLEGRGDGRLVAVLEVPDLRRSAERAPEQRDEARVVALADEACPVHGVRPLAR